MNIQANTYFNCPFCDRSPEIMVRDDGKCGIFCANEYCMVNLEVKSWCDSAQDAEEEWDNAIGVLVSSGFRC